MQVSEAVDYLIAYSIDHDIPMSNSKLHCLLYYAQAWRLAIYDESLFDDPIEAAEEGPVLPSIDCQLRARPPRVESGIKWHLDSVMGRYGFLADQELVRLTQTEAPWVVARSRIPVNGKQFIRNQEMELFYRYGSADIVTRAAVFSCLGWTAIQRAFSLHLSTI